MIIHIKVVPNSKAEIFEKISEREYKIKVREKAVDGKANERVREILAGKFGVSKTNVLIKSPNSRKKVVEILEE